jgi:methionyl-tRNA synthetase
MLGPSGPNTAAATDTNPAPLSAEATIKGTTSVVPQNSPAQAPALAAETILPAESERALLKHHQDLFAADILRYFLLREIPFGQDGSFSFDALITRYNADLAGGFGNLVRRTTTMIASYLDGKNPDLLVVMEKAKQHPDELIQFAWRDCDNLSRDLPETVEQAEAHFRKREFGQALERTFRAITLTDILIAGQAPWTSKAGHTEGDTALRRMIILGSAAESIRIITLLLNPILPYATAKVWAQLGLNPADLTSQDKTLRTENRELRTDWGGLQPGTKLGPLSPIFPRADKGLAQIMSDLENPAPIACVTGPNDPPAARLSAITAQHDATHPATDDLPTTPIASEQSVSIGVSSVLSLSTPTDSEPQITIDDFIKIDLRVAQIVVAERIPKADKLLRLEVDLGYEKRQILSGIAEWYTPEELIGRRIVVIANLAPRKMRGLESHGMLLAASTEGGKPHLATFTDAETLPLGSRLK